MAIDLALVVPSLGNGGGVPAVAKFLATTACSSNAFRLHLVSLSTGSRDEFSARLASPMSILKGPRAIDSVWQGLPFVEVGCWFAELEFQRYRPRRVLSDILRAADVIQVVCGSPAWANAVCGLGKPVSLQVATRAKVERRMRDKHPIGLTGRWRRQMTVITDWLDDRALKSVNAIQVENPWMLEYAQTVTNGRDVDLRYAPPGVNDKVFTPKRDGALSQDRPYLLCVGRLDDPRKNIGLLLESYALCAQRCPTVDLVMAGSSGPPPSFWERVQGLGLAQRVAYVARPTRDELVRLYQNAVAFALSSDEEGLGVVILEAMSCGVPVVATRCGGPDGIIADGHDGFLVPMNDAAAMANRLVRLLTDARLAVAMGRNARQTIQARYSEGAAGEAFIDVWETLARKGAASVQTDRRN